MIFLFQIFSNLVLTGVRLGFRLDGGGCGGGPRWAPADRDEVEPPDPFIIGFCFHPPPEEEDSVDGVRFMAGRPPAGALLGDGVLLLLAGPSLPLPVAFNVGIPPEY